MRFSCVEVAAGPRRLFDQTVYPALDDFGRLGPAYGETDMKQAILEMAI
jgi:hypothetical protein